MSAVSCNLDNMDDATASTKSMEFDSFIELHRSFISGTKLEATQLLSVVRHKRPRIEKIMVCT